MTTPTLAGTAAAGHRVYRWQGREFPSVTAILNGGVPKPFLVRWAAKAAAEYAIGHLDHHPGGEVGPELGDQFLQCVQVGGPGAGPGQRPEQLADLGPIAAGLAQEVDQRLAGGAGHRRSPPWRRVSSPRQGSLRAW